MPTISDIIPWIEHKVCKTPDKACTTLARSLMYADYLDADYDSIAHTFKLTAYWSQPWAGAQVWKDSHQSSKGQTIEVGVLMNEKPSEPEELKFSGWLTIPGEGKEPCKSDLPCPLKRMTTNCCQLLPCSTLLRGITQCRQLSRLRFEQPSNSRQACIQSCNCRSRLTQWCHQRRRVPCILI